MHQKKIYKIAISSKFSIQKNSPKKLNQILADNTGKPVEQVAEDTERDHWMDAKEALDYGLVDSIITNRE